MLRIILPLFVASLNAVSPALAAAPLGCEYSRLAAGAAPTVNSCNGTEEPQPPFRAIEPNTSFRYVTGMEAAAGGNGGPFRICIPVPNGVSVDNYQLSLAGATVTASSASLVPATDGNIQGNYCVDYGTDQTTIAAGARLLLGVDLTFDPISGPEANFFSAAFDGGVVNACDAPGSRLPVCYVERLDLKTQPVNTYTADLEGCGFDILAEADAPVAPALCVDNPGAQTEGRYEPGSTHQLIYGLRVGQDADLGGVFSVRLPIPLGVTVGDARLFHTDRTTTTELFAGVNATLGLDTSTADGAIQGHYVATWNGNRNALPPGDKVWLSLDVTLGSFDAVFTTAGGASGSLTSDCTVSGGTGTTCPVDNLPALTMQVTQYTADLEGCGFDILAEGDAAVPPTVCVDNPGAQTEGVFEPNTTHQLIYGMQVGENADLGGVYAIRLPVPRNVSVADPHLYLTTGSGTTELTDLAEISLSLDTSTADSQIQGHYVSTYTGGRAALVPGDKLWMSLDVTLDLFDVTFTTASGASGPLTTDCSQQVGNATECPVDNLPALTMDVREYTANLQGCGFDLWASGTTPVIPSTCADNPGPQTAPSLNAGDSRLITYGMRNPRGANAATLTGTYNICLPMPVGATYSDTRLWHTPDGLTATELSARFDLDTATADSVKAGDLCVSSDLPATLTPGSTLWASVDITFGSTTATFGSATNVPGQVTTDCSGPGGNATVCPVDSLPLLTVPILGPGQILVTYSSGRELSTSEDGTTDSVTFSLSRQPGSDVAFTVESSDLTEGEVVGSTDILITRAAWQTGVEVVVQGVDDDLVDGQQSLVLSYSSTTSADSSFNGIAGGEVLWTNQDDDNAGAVVTPTSLATSEAGTQASFEVLLTAQPASDVTLDIAGLDATEGSLSTTALSFDSTNWNQAQTVTVTGLDDAAVDGPITYTLALGPLVSNDGAFSGVSVSSVRVTNADNDTPGVTVTTDTGVGGEASLSTDESGTTDTVSLVLNTQPSDTVTVPVSSSDLSEGTVDPSEVVFTTANWNVPQEITVTGVDDTLVDGTVTLDLIIDPMVSNDANYNDIDLDDVVWNNADDDSATVVLDIDPDTTTLRTTEAGGTDSFTVALSAEPTASVSLSLSSSDTSEGTVTSSLTFDSSNWSVPQTVTVTGVDDALQDGDIGYAVVLAPLVSADAAFDGIDLADIPAVNEDDDSAGVRVDPATGTTTEAGGTHAFAVSLSSAPTANVTVALASDDTSEGTVSPASLTFTAANWDTPQTATVTGVDDFLVDGDVSYQVRTTVTSSDAAYDGISAADVALVNEDDDAADLLFDGGGVIAALETSESGTTDSFTVALTAEPTADVTISVVVDDTTEASVSSSSLVFTAADWQTAQTVTVTGEDDAEIDGDIAFTVRLTASSADSTVSGVIGSIEGTNTDNDTAGIVVDPIEGLITDELGATATFDVVLTASPSADVTIALSVDDATEAELGVSALTFTSADWSTAQTVTVTGLDDDLNDGDVPYTIVLAPATSADAAFDGLDADDVSATNLDDGADGGDSGDTDQMDSDTVWVQGGCDCSVTGGAPAPLWLAPAALLTLLRRRRAA